MSLALGDVIFVAVKPIIKIYLMLTVGYALVKANMLTMETSRGISNMVVNALGPALTFNKIVTNLSGSEIKEIAVLVLTGVTIFGTGLFLTFVASFALPVPREWRYGMLFAGLFSNISDLPIAYVQSMDTGKVFSAAQGDKAAALSIVLASVQQFLMMNCGLFQMIGLDFREKKDEEKGVDSGASQLNRETREGSVIVLDRNRNNEDKEEDDEADADDDNDGASSGQYDVIPLVNEGSSSDSDMESATRTITIRRNSTRRGSAQTRRPSASSFSRIYSNDSGYSTRSHRSRAQTIQSIVDEYSEAERIKTIPNINALAKSLSRAQEVGLNVDDDDEDHSSYHEPTEKPSSHRSLEVFITKYKLGWLKFVALNMIRVPSIVLILALVVAMIPWVRALFVTNSINMPQAPDDKPPLSFVMDFSSYVGNAAIPMGIFLLGGTLARLQIEQIPKGFWKIQITIVLIRLVILPIIGVLWTNRLYSGDLIDETVARFLIILSWSCPSSTSQIYFTAFYTPLDGPHLQMDCCALMLVAQYPILVISLPFVVTYTLKVNLGM